MVNIDIRSGDVPIDHVQRLIERVLVLARARYKEELIAALNPRGTFPYATGFMYDTVKNSVTETEDAITFTGKNVTKRGVNYAKIHERRPPWKVRTGVVRPFLAVRRWAAKRGPEIMVETFKEYGIKVNK